MNTIIMSGNIVRDVETITVSNGWSILKFPIANNDESRKQQDGSYINIASFFDCEYLTKKPDTWIRRLQKGSGIVIQGKLKQEQWEKDGQKRSKAVIKIDGFPMNLASRDEMQASVTNSAPPVKSFNKPPVPNASSFKQAPAVSPESFEDDIPF